MKKRLFFGFASFVGFALLIAWQFAAAELADIQEKKDAVLDNRTIEVASSPVHPHLFV